MDFLEYPNKESWQKRRDWVDKELMDGERGCHFLSDHAVALFLDMQVAYCSGAWISVIVMSVSVIDAHLRETEAMDNNIGTARLLSTYYEGEDIDWLRQLRNRYVHNNLDRPLFGMNDWFDSQVELEAKATKAIKMAINAVFQNPGV